MMALILDTGALIGFELGHREVTARIEATRRQALPVLTSTGCVAQSWHGDGSRQALLARLLAGVRELPLDARSSRGIGKLCAKAGRSDMVDAHVAFLAGDADVLITSDPDDLQALLHAASATPRLVSC